MNKLTKLVNGKIVELTDDEQIQVQSEWQANDAKYADYLANEKYKDDRRKEYPTTNELIVALWEHIVENKIGAIDLLQQKRAEIKTKYSKPS